MGGELLDQVAGASAARWGALLSAPFVGSFLGVVVRRLPEGRPIAWVRSRCECCGAALSAWDLVPFCSWLASGGRCRYCGHPLGWIDVRRWLLPDSLTLPLIIAGLAGAVAFDPEQLTDRALGAALGYLSLRAIAVLYRGLRNREGLGHGDAKLLAASGAWVGAMALPQVVLGAAVLALFTAACLRLAGVRLGPGSAVPFGPFLALATWLVWLLGPFLI